MCVEEEHTCWDGNAFIMGPQTFQTVQTKRPFKTRLFFFFCFLSEALRSRPAEESDFLPCRATEVKISGLEWTECRRVMFGSFSVDDHEKSQRKLVTSDLIPSHTNYKFRGDLMSYVHFRNLKICVTKSSQFVHSVRILQTFVLNNCVVQFVSRDAAFMDHHPEIWQKSDSTGSVSKALESQSEEYGFNKKQCASKKQEQNRFIIDVIIIVAFEIKTKLKSTTKVGQQISHKELHTGRQFGGTVRDERRRAL